MLGFDNIALFSHEIESTYDLVREGKLKVLPRLISLTLLARDHINSLLNGPPNPDLQRVGEQIISGFLDFQKAGGVVNQPVRKIVDPVETDSQMRVYRIRFQPAPDIFRRAINVRLLFLELQGLGECSVSCDTHRLPDLADFDCENCYLNWDIILSTDKGELAIHEVFRFADEDSAVEIAAAEPTQTELAEPEHSTVLKSAAAKTEAPSLRVAADKLDNLVNIVGEMVTMQARLTQVAAVCGDPEVGFVAEEMERLADKLRDSTLSIRMLPLGATFRNLSSPRPRSVT